MITVLDASVVASWALPTQHTPTAAKLLESADQHRFLVPHIFYTEVRNFLLSAERRDGFTIEQSETALDALSNLDITEIDLRHSTEMRTAMGIAREERLSMYDGLYLYLALTDYADLASRDGPLLAAAERRNVGIVDVRA